MGITPFNQLVVTIPLKLRLLGFDLNLSWHCFLVWSKDPHRFEGRIPEGDVTFLSDLRELLTKVGWAALLPLSPLPRRPLVEGALEKFVQPTIRCGEGFHRRKYGRILAYFVAHVFTVFRAIFVTARGSTV